MGKLHILNGKRQGDVVSLTNDREHTFGHRPDADVAIEDPWVSWDHARVFCEGARFWVEDLGSTNGTWVNYNRVQREVLKDHDVVNFGKTQLLYLEDAPAHAVPAPAPAPARLTRWPRDWTTHQARQRRRGARWQVPARWVW